MSFKKTLFVPITFTHQIEESRHELKADDYIAALKANLAEVERDPAAAWAQIIHSAKLEVEVENAWVLRLSTEKNVVVRGKPGVPVRLVEDLVTLPSVRDLAQTDIFTANEAAARYAVDPVDPAALFVPLDYFDLDLVVAEIHNGAGDLVGLVDLRSWFNRAEEADLKAFLIDPGAGEVFFKVLEDALESGSPNVRHALTQRDLTMTVRDMDAAKEILHDLRYIFIDDEPQP
jgi:hypothetical protein